MRDKNIPESWLICSDKFEWREWLTANHLKEYGVWLQIRKIKSKDTGVLLKEAVGEAICFGWIDGKMFSIDDEKYIIRMTPRRKDSMWSLINRKRAEELIAEGRMTQAGMDAINEAKANGRWEAAYSSKAAPKLPDDLRIELEKNLMAMKNFSKWPNNHKLQAVTWIIESKYEKTRKNRIEKIVELAKNGKRLIQNAYQTKN